MTEALINIAGHDLHAFHVAVLVIGILLAYVFLAPTKTKKPKLPKVNFADELSQYKSGGKYYVTEPDACLPILQAKKGVASRAPGLVMTSFRKAAATKGDKPALESVDGKFWTWKEYLADTMTAASGFVSLGFQQYDTVSIIGFNSPEWVISNMAAIAAGGKAAGIYTTSAPDAIEYIVNHSKSSIAVCEDDVQLDKFLLNIKKLTTLKAIVVYKSGFNKERKEGNIEIMSWATFMKRGKDAESNSKAEIERRISASKPGNCCILIYTSGTTGNPKACMISNDAILFEAACVMSCVPSLGSNPNEAEHIISYLPLSHIAGQMVDIFSPIILTCDGVSSCCLHFADANALKGTLGETLRRVRPTIFLGVPRVWEKVSELMKAKAKGNAGIKLHLANWAKAIGLKRALSSQLGGSGVVPRFYGVADAVIFKTVKKALGLERCKFALTGAAPITKDTLTYFGQLGLQINEVYGMSESCAATTFSTDETHIWGSCGFAMPGCEVKVDHQDARGDKAGEGELCYRGRHIMMGYLYDEDKTKEAIDSDGWLHSGDVGKVDKFGMYHITGRIKELIVSAGGEKYPPIPCEDGMKKNCPGIANVMMVGDKRKFNVLLVCLKSKIDKDGNPIGDLDSDALDVDKSCKTIAQAQKSKIWEEYIKKGMKLYNDSCPSNAHKVQYHTILDRDFSVNGGELTATLKLKRMVCMEKYKKEIDALYAGKE